MGEKRDSSSRRVRIINSLISTYQEVISHATAGDVRLELGNCPLYRLHGLEDTRFRKEPARSSNIPFYSTHW